MTVAVDFNINADTPSRPADLAELNEQNIYFTSFSLQRIDAGQLQGSRGAGLLSEWKDWLKPSYVAVNI